MRLHAPSGAQTSVLRVPGTLRSPPLDGAILPQNSPAGSKNHPRSVILRVTLPLKRVFGYQFTILERLAMGFERFEKFVRFEAFEKFEGFEEFEESVARSAPESQMSLITA